MSEDLPEAHLHEDDLFPDISDSHVSINDAGKFLISDVGQLRHIEFLFCVSAASLALGAAGYGMYALSKIKNDEDEAADEEASEDAGNSPCHSELAKRGS